MSSNIFNGKRFWLLSRQYLIHNNKNLLISIVAYVGIIFIVLSLVQIGQDRMPLDLNIFKKLLIAFVAIFGIFYVGYSFPAFRSKEATINYLMQPGSILEKYIFELIIRIGLMLVLLPFLFWITFHLQGYFFSLFTTEIFQPVGLFNGVDFTIPDDAKDISFWFVIMVVSLISLAFVIPFIGGAMFSKQPLVKTLFSMAIILIIYSAVTYFALETLGVGRYHINDSVKLIPDSANGLVRFFGCSAIIAVVVMLFVAYRKLKEKEV